VAKSPVDPAQIDVIAPNFKKRLSGVTATVVRLVPLQARDIAIAATCPVDLPDVPQIPLLSLLTLSRRKRVWHARRNVEMIGGLILRHILRKRLALLFTSASQRSHTGLSRWLIARMDRVVATSAKSAGYLQREAQVIHHGIDISSFAPAPDKAALRARLGLPPAGPVIGCYGRIRHQKGTDVFVDTALDLLTDHPTLTAVVMGRATSKDRGFEAELRRKVAAAGAQERVIFAPEVPVWEIADWYAALDLYVAPQRWEGFGLTPLEAMASGVPVVATRVGAFEELIVEGQTGALVPRDDLPAMTRAVGAALADQDALKKRSAQARTHAEQHFDIAAEAAALVAIYREMLA
jgi:mannosyltransferase